MIGSLLRIVWYAFNGLPTRTTGGKSTGGKQVSEGQTWKLKQDINHELRSGMFEVVGYYDDRILLTRKDGRHDLPPGCLPIFPIDILDDGFELVERDK